MKILIAIAVLACTAQAQDVDSTQWAIDRMQRIDAIKRFHRCCPAEQAVSLQLQIEALEERVERLEQKSERVKIDIAPGETVGYTFDLHPETPEHPRATNHMIQTRKLDPACDWRYKATPNDTLFYLLR